MANNILLIYLAHPFYVIFLLYSEPVHLNNNNVKNRELRIDIF